MSLPRIHCVSQFLVDNYLHVNVTLIISEVGYVLVYIPMRRDNNIPKWHKTLAALVNGPRPMKTLSMP